MFTGFLKTIGNYGLDGANYMATKIISMILNNYGPKLLKIDSAKLIVENICDQKQNIFKLGTLEFKELRQEWSNSTIVIERCTMSNPVIIVPWKNILTEPTEVTISDIAINASVVKTPKSAPRTTNLEDSYLYATPMKSVDLPSTNTETLKANNIIQIYNEVNEILEQYFQKVNLQIDLLNFYLGSVKIIFNDVRYQNRIASIKLIEIMEIGTIENVIYDLEKEILDIQNIEINHEHESVMMVIKSLPKLFLQTKSSQPSTTNICIQIANFKWVGILLTWQIVLHIKGDNIILQKISNIELPSVCLLTVNSTTSILEFANGVLIFNSVLNARIGSNENVISWYQLAKMFANELIQHLCWDLEKATDFKAKFLDLHIVRALDGSVIDIAIDEISLHDSSIIINTLRTIYKGVVTTSAKITFTDGVVEIIDLNSKTLNTLNHQLWTLLIGNLSFNIESPRNIGKSLTLHITRGQVSRLENVVAYILDVVADVKTIVAADELSSEPPVKINLSLTDSKIHHIQSDFNFVLNVQQGQINLSDLELLDVKMEILMSRLGGDVMICSLNASFMSKTLVDIDSIKLFVDPEIFDDLNYIFGTLPKADSNHESVDKKPFDPENLKKLQQALQSSNLYENPEDFQKKLTESAAPIVKLLEGFGSELTTNYSRKAIGFPLGDQDSRKAIGLASDNQDSRKAVGLPSENTFALNIRSCHLYLYGSLYAMRKQNYFVSVVLRTISLTRKISIAHELGDSVCIKIHEPGLFDGIDQSVQKTREDYTFVIKSGIVLDATTEDPNWKYLLKFNNNNTSQGEQNLIKIHAYKMQSMLSMEVCVAKISAAIREESFIKLLSFISNSHRRPQTSEPLYITQFQINTINAEISYLPATIENLTGSDMLSFKNMNLVLKSQTIRNQNDFGAVFTILKTNWREDTLNIYNAIKLVPSLGIVQPYTSPATRMAYIVGSYLGNAGNKLKLREFTYSLAGGVNFVGSLASRGINHIWDLFKRDQ
jgi:hypothetical protein